MLENGKYVRYQADDDEPILKPLMRHIEPGLAEMELGALVSGDGIPLITGRVHDGYVCMTISEAKCLQDQLGKALSIAEDLSQIHKSFEDY